MKIEKIRKHCEWIIDHFKEINYFDEFTNNEELVYSSAFVLSKIGELAKRLDQEKKKIYQELISIVEQFFEKEKSYDLYLKLRAYIKNHFAK